MGQRSAVVLGLVALACAGCDDDYPIAPTPCDDYCLATQRAGCDEDWPDECVSNCELTVSPRRFPECADEFDTALACFQALDDDDFVCVDDFSEPRAGVCAEETLAQNYCLGPVYYRCLTLCETRGDRCEGTDVRSCLVGCRGIPHECEEEAVRWLECELADESACAPILDCTSLASELSYCIDATGSAG